MWKKGGMECFGCVKKTLPWRRFPEGFAAVRWSFSVGIFTGCARRLHERTTADVHEHGHWSVVSKNLTCRTAATMASSLLLLDDIASVLDNFSLMTRVAAKKLPVSSAMFWPSMPNR